MHIYYKVENNYLEFQREWKIICLKYSDFLGKSPLIFWNNLISLSFLCYMYIEEPRLNFSPSQGPFLLYVTPSQASDNSYLTSSHFIVPAPSTIGLLSLFLCQGSDFYPNVCRILALSPSIPCFCPLSPTVIEYDSYAALQHT